MSPRKRHHRHERHERKRSAPFEQGVAHYLLLGLLVFMPLSFGAVEAWSLFVVTVGACGLLACLAIRAWRHRTIGGLTWTPAYIPLALFIGLALLHALPVPFGLIELLSPQAASLYGDLRDDITGAFTLSLYPRATWQDLCVVISAAVVFMTVVTFYRRDSQIKRLLLGIATIGAVLAVLALAQGLFGNGRIYWIGPAEFQANSGTFACHNHFSQHMVLSVMAMLAYAMVSTRETIGRTWLDKESAADWLTGRELRAIRWLLLLAVVGLIAVAMSTSRMGTVSAAVGLAFMVSVFAMRHGVRHANLPILVGLITVSAVILIGFELVFERMATVGSFEAYENRWTVVKDLVPAIGDYPLIGSGLGTFSVVYPMYDTGFTWRLATHAENEYAQLLLEMGVAGFAIVAAFVLLIGRSALRALRRMNRPLFVAAPPLAAGLLAVMLHSWTDFGQHLPAIACLSAVFCGLLVVLGQRAGQHGREAQDMAPESQAAVAPAYRRQLLVACSLGVMAMVLTLNLPAGIMRAFAERYDAAALQLAERLERGRWHGTDTDYTNLVELGERAVGLDPGNVVYRYRLGVYRWWAVVRDRSPEQLEGEQSPLVLETARTIVDEMISASASCPTMGSIHSWRGQLEWWVLGMAEGRDRVEKAVRTARNDRVTLHAAGVLAAVENEPELAFERFRRSLEVRGDLASAATVLLDELKRPDLALSLAGDDAQRLHDMAGLLGRKGYEQQSLDARRRSIEHYRDRIGDPAIPAWALAMLAEVSVREGDHEQAVTLYGMALAREYANTNWRAANIRCLMAVGQLEQAEYQTDVLQRLNAPQKLIDTLRAELATLRRAAATQPVTAEATR